MAQDLVRQALRGGVLLSAAHLWLTLTSYLIAVILARTLGPAVYGVYGVVYAVLLTVELIGRLGLPQAIAKLSGGGEGRRLDLERSALSLAALVYGVIFLGFLAAAPLLAEIFDVADGAALFRLAALDIPFYGVFFVALGVLNGRQAFAFSATATALYATARATGLLLLAPTGLTVEKALLVNAGGSAAGLLLIATFVGRRSLRPSLAAAGKLLRLALPLSLRGLGAQLLAISGLMMLGLLSEAVSDADKGLYVAATSVARLPSLAVFGLVGALVPSLARAQAAGDTGAARETLRQTVGLVLFATLPAAAFLCVEAPEVMSLLYSPPYAAGGHLLAILAMALGLFFNLAQILTAALIAGSHPGPAAALSLGSVALAMLASLLMVPALGAAGAALATALAAVALVAAAGLLVHRSFGPWLALTPLLKTLAATALVALAAGLLPGQGVLLLAEAALCGLGYLLVLWALRGLPPALAERLPRRLPWP